MPNNDKLELTREKILNKQFTKNIKGYDSLEVDEFLDIVIQDYGSFKSYMEESKRYTQTLEMENSRLKDKARSLELENSKLNARLKGIKPGDKVTTDNIDLYQRIAFLEDFLYQQGYDVKNLK